MTFRSTGPLTDTWNGSVNMHVPSAHFSSMVNGSSGEYRVHMGAPVGADADGILNDQSVAAIVDVTSFAAAYDKDNMGPYGRNVTVVASGAATSTLIVHGKDYLGQPMSESFTLNGNTPVAGKKAFKEIVQVEINDTTSATTVDIGWGDVFGLPFKTQAIQSSIEDEVSATAATLVGGIATATTQTATTGDPRGTIDFNGSPNGTKVFEAVLVADLENLYGNAHYSSL